MDASRSTRRRDSASSPISRGCAATRSRRNATPARIADCKRGTRGSTNIRAARRACPATIAAESCLRPFRKHDHGASRLPAAPDAARRYDRLRLRRRSVARGCAGRRRAPPDGWTRRAVDAGAVAGRTMDRVRRPR